MSGASQSSIDYLKCLYVKNLDNSHDVNFRHFIFFGTKQTSQSQHIPLPNNNAGMPYDDF